MSLPSSMADFVPCDLSLQKAYWYKISSHARKTILRDPGASSRDDAIFLGESLLQELKSPWALILTKPVPEVVEFRPADWAEKYFSTKPRKSQDLTWGLGTNTLPSIFSADLSNLVSEDAAKQDLCISSRFFSKSPTRIPVFFMERVFPPARNADLRDTWSYDFIIYILRVDFLMILFM